VGLQAGGAALAEVLVTLGRIAGEHPDIEEVDVNPLILTSDGPVAVDALVVLSGRDLPVA
jgi:hypothetical protein